MECKYAEFVREGRGMILPLIACRDLCAAEGLPFNVSKGFLVPKAGKPLGRLVSDYTGIGNNINDPSKKDLLSTKWGPIVHPKFADINTLFLNAFQCFPGEDIYGTRVDINAAHNRIRIYPPHIFLCAMLFEHGTSQYVFLPFENQFGKQDTVSHWMLAGSSIQHLSDCRNLNLHGRILSTRYEDDFAGAFSDSAADIEISALELDANARCGTDAVSQTKTIKSQTATILGFLWNTKNKTVTVSERIFRKVLRLLFLHTPSSPQINDCVSIVTLQRLGSYAIRLSSCLTCLLPFSRGFHAATCRVPFTCPYSKWTERSIGELAIWRAAFTLSLHDYRWLEVPMFQIGILCYAPSDGDSSTSPDVRESNRSRRQAAIASLVGYGDACTTNNGLGVYIPDTLWMGMNFQPLSHLLLASGERRAIDINVLEFIAALLTSLALIESLDKLPSITLRHIHIWTDNTACLSWMKKHKADHPLHLFLLYVFSFIQIKNRVLITLGHIPGVHNIYADASSRNFICPNGQSILRHLLQFPQWFAPPAFMTGIVLASALQSLDISQLVAAALTALELPTSSGFVPTTTLISTSPPQDLPNENMLFTSFLTYTRSATSLPQSSTNTLATFVPHSSNKALSRTAPNSALPDFTSCLSPSNEQNLLTPFVSVKESPPFSLLSPKLSSLSPNSSAPIPTLPLPSKHHLLRVTAAPFVPKNTSSVQSPYTTSPLPINCALLTAPSGGATVFGMFTTSTVAPPSNPLKISSPSSTSTRITSSEMVAHGPLEQHLPVFPFV
jgi:hypothetical protein